MHCRRPNPDCRGLAQVRGLDPPERPYLPLNQEHFRDHAEPSKPPGSRSRRCRGNSILPVTAPAGEEVSVYEAAGGARAMLPLARAWHQRCLADPEAQHPFSHPGLHPQHTERLAAYWGEMLGGPDAYSRGLASVAHMVRINHTYEQPELVPDDVTLPHWSWGGPVE